MKNRSTRLPVFSLIWISLLSVLILNFQWACAGNPNNADVTEEHPSAPAADDSEHSDHDSMVRFTDSQMKEFGIEAGPAVSGILPIEVVLP